MHWGRVLFLVVVLVLIGFAGYWAWNNVDIRPYLANTLGQTDVQPTYTAVPVVSVPAPSQTSAVGSTVVVSVIGTVTPSVASAVPVTNSVTAAATVPQTTTALIGLCPQAEQLGPWAPSANGQGETFEVTAARGPVHLSAWWPTANTPWEQAEVSVVITPGISISVINGAGTAWDYPVECSQTEVDRQIAIYRATRGDWTVFYGPVTLQQLLDLKLVEIRTKRTVATCPPAVASVQAKPGDFSITGPAVASIWWLNVPETRFLVPISTTVRVLGGAGSYWVYGEGCSSDFLNKEMAKGNFPVTTVDQLRTKSLVQ